MNDRQMETKVGNKLAEREITKNGGVRSAPLIKEYTSLSKGLTNVASALAV